MEERSENLMWFGRNIFAFVLASFITAFIMLILGFPLGSGEKKEGP